MCLQRFSTLHDTLSLFCGNGQLLSLPPQQCFGDIVARKKVNAKIVWPFRTVLQMCAGKFWPALYIVGMQTSVYRLKHLLSTATRRTS